jgi:hypothetical protein
VGKGFALLEVVEHVIEIVGSNDLSHLLIAMGPRVKEVDI